MLIWNSMMLKCGLELGCVGCIGWQVLSGIGTDFEDRILGVWTDFYNWIWTIIVASLRGQKAAFRDCCMGCYGTTIGAVECSMESDALMQPYF